MPKTNSAVGHRYYVKEREVLTNRMKRIEGQAKGIMRMIEEDRYCIDIVQQLTALSSAADEVALIILQNHIEGCVTDAIRERRGQEYIEELMATVRKAMKR
ncbi:MAG: metal-sensitive transcriptional regulator [Chloroflexota bacterium]